MKVVIEVKSTLTSGTFKEALINLDCYTAFKEHVRPHSNILKCIFAYQIGKKFPFPEGIFRLLSNYYSNEKIWPNIDRIAYGRNSSTLDHWSFPWIAVIVVLGVGVVSLRQWNIDGKTYPIFTAHSKSTSVDDTYGILEQNILAEVLDCKSYGIGQMDRPGIIDSLLNWPNAKEGIAHYSLEQLPSKINKMGNLSQIETKNLLGKFYKTKEI